MFIKYANSYYPIRELYWDGCTNIIGTYKLEKELIADGLNYSDKEARRIDEMIIFYVNDSQINLSDEELCSILDSEIKNV